MDEHRRSAALRRNIVIVEDDPRDSQLLAQALREVNPSQPIREFRTAEACLEFVAKLPGSSEPFPSLFLIDLALPGQPGRELARALRAIPSIAAVPIAIVTGDHSPASIRECYDAGVSSYLFKPDDWSGLRELAKQLSIYWIVHNRPPPLPAPR